MPGALERSRARFWDSAPQTASFAPSQAGQALRRGEEQGGGRGLGFRGAPRGVALEAVIPVGAEDGALGQSGRAVFGAQASGARGQNREAAQFALSGLGSRAAGQAPDAVESQFIGGAHTDEQHPHAGTFRRGAWDIKKKPLFGTAAEVAGGQGALDDAPESTIELGRFSGQSRICARGLARRFRGRPKDRNRQQIRRWGAHFTGLYTDFHFT